MSPFRQIRVVYVKELIDILRDRRTLLAMILIPVVLYPTIVLGFLWLAQAEEDRLRGERFVVGVDDEQTAADLESMIQRAQAAAALPSDQQNTYEIRVDPRGGTDPGGRVHLHAAIEVREQGPPLPPQVTVRLTYNEVDYLSRKAMEQLSLLLGKFRELVTREGVLAVLAHTLPQQAAPAVADQILNPLRVESVSVATVAQRGGWALGQIVPVILVLMTITGAIYPAIDLTAGERERGTLETLMVTPVPMLRLMIGKFLVVATIALLTASLNLLSVGATMHFGGLTRALTAEHPVEFPVSVLPVVLACLVPLALLFAAVLLAVCSFARTFKEAQNYVMPVIVAALVPGAMVSLPSARLEGGMLVLPVGNMVLLCRELFQQTASGSAVAVVLLSTTLYAVAAIVLAARLFGQEAVLFPDAGSYRTLLDRRCFRPADRPTTAQALVLAAVLFPLSFHLQGALFGESLEGLDRKLAWVVIVQFGLLFVLVPAAFCLYFRIRLRPALGLSAPPAWAWGVALLLGLSSWAPAHEFVLLQPRSQALEEMSRQLVAHLEPVPFPWLLLGLAVAPALAEELFFRGFLLGGLAGALRRGWAVVVCGLIFGVFHFMIDRIPLTALLGMVLAFLCWQCRSVWPGMLFHALHNSASLIWARFPGAAQWLGMTTATGEPGHVRAEVLISACSLFLLGLLLTWQLGERHRADLKAG